VRLIYRATDCDGAPIDVNELVNFVYTPTRFGGRQQWLGCLRCGRGCRKIYGGQYFRCRRCYSLRAFDQVRAWLYRNQRKPHGQAVSRVYREVLSVLLSFAVKYDQAYPEFACESRRESAFLARETSLPRSRSPC
jgi:hypothetical protein